MSGRNRAERAHLDRLAELGCIVCLRLGHGHTEPHIHHPRFAAGMGQRASDWLAIPLCPMHHQHGGPGVALHAGQRQFEALYGTEEDLLAETLRRLFSACG